MHELVGYALLALAGLAGGWVNSFAGAGSLLTLPALVFTGLDASAANATNRIAVLVQSAAAVVAYERSGVRATRAAVTLALPAMVTAALGAWLATLLSADAIRLCIAAAMLVMLPLSFVRPRRRAAVAEAEAGPAPRSPVTVTAPMLVAFAAVGLYGGFLQAGVGIVILLALSLGWGVDLITANGVKVLVVLALTVVALTTFALSRATIDLGRGAILAVATAIGGYVGARTAARRGERLVRWGVVVAVVASVVKLVWDLR